MASVDFEVTIDNIYPDLEDDDLDEDGEYTGPDAMKVSYPENVKQKSVIRDSPGVVTVTLEMSIDGDYLPTMLADEDEWNEWGEENILPHTGIGKTGGESGYAAEITAVTSIHRDDEFDYLVGQKWEWL